MVRRIVFHRSPRTTRRCLGFRKTRASWQRAALPELTSMTLALPKLRAANSRGFTKAQAATGSARRAMKTIRLTIGCALSRTLQLRRHSLRRLLDVMTGWTSKSTRSSSGASIRRGAQDLLFP